MRKKKKKKPSQTLVNLVSFVNRGGGTHGVVGVWELGGALPPFHLLAFSRLLSPVSTRER